MGSEEAGRGAGELIDIHAHAVLEGTFSTAGRHGPELLEGDTPRFRAGDYVLHGVRYRGSPFMDPEVRIARMDEVGIDRQVLSPNPLTYFHGIEPPLAVEFCRRHNDLMAQLVGEHRDRLLGLAALPMQDVDAAVAELRRAVRDLGLVGAYIGTEFAQHQLDDPTLDPFYEACVDLDVPLFLHPNPDGIDRPVKDPRLRRWDLELVAGFAYDETLAVAALVYGGVLQRHPQLDVCISHGGGAAPYLYGRMAAAAHRPWAPDWLREDGAFDRLLRRIWFDCHVHHEPTLRLLADVAGSERIVFGTNFGGWDQGGGMDLSDLDGPIRANTRRLLRL
jgi:aminocarboxymuconate-semialdehyde decarboxylase